MKRARRVLLIEDNRGDARLVREMLADQHRVQVELEQASTFAEGVAAIERQPFDALLVDLGLPDSQGLETFERLHARYPSIPTIVLTGMDDTELAGQAVLAGAQDYIPKGAIAADGLARAIQYAIERKKGEEALRRSEQILRSFYESSPMMMGIVEVADDGSIHLLHENRVSAQLFAALRGAQQDAAKAEVLELWVRRCRNNEEAGRPVTFEYPHEGRDGIVWLSAHLAPLGEAAGGRQFCFIAEDVTARKHAEQELNERAEDLQRSNAELQEFNRLSMGRELRMIELKKQVNELCHELGRPPQFDVDFESNEAVSVVSDVRPDPTVKTDATMG